MSAAPYVPAARRRRRRILLGGAAFALIGAAWQAAAAWHWVNPVLVSSPSAVLGAFASQVRTGELGHNLAVSASELAAGFALAAGVGIVVGLLMGRLRLVEYALDPIVWLSYSAPFIALYPMLLVVFGLGRPTVIVITFLLTVVPIIVNTAAGVRGVDPKLVQAARSFGAGELRIFAAIALPGAVPLIMAGLRLAIGRALVGVVIGEFFTGSAGIGYSINYYSGVLQTDNMLVGVLVSAALGIALTQALSAVEHRVDHWRGDPARA